MSEQQHFDLQKQIEQAEKELDKLKTLEKKLLQEKIEQTKNCKSWLRLQQWFSGYEGHIIKSQYHVYAFGLGDCVLFMVKGKPLWMQRFVKKPEITNRTTERHLSEFYTKRCQNEPLGKKTPIKQTKEINKLFKLWAKVRKKTPSDLCEVDNVFANHIIELIEKNETNR